MLLINYLSNTKNHFYILTVLLFIGVLIRIIGISTLPTGLNQDEASIGYDAFSIMTSGLDRNADSYPIHLKSWGSGQNALYAYLSMPFISWFGLNTFSVRIVNAIASCLSLLVFYSIFKLVFDKKKALMALALLVICPWSIMSARWGLESNIFPTFFLFGIYFLLLGISKSQKFFPISFSIFAICLYSYGTSYLTLPVFFALLIPYLIYQKNISRKYLFISLFAFTILAMPIILFVIINHLDLPPIHIFNITIPRLESNRTTEIFNLLGSNFLTEFSKNIVRFLNILILQTDGNEYNSTASFGTIFQISIPFLILGIYDVIKNKKKLKQPTHYIFISWLIAAILLGISSHVNINRINIIFYPLIYFVVMGFYSFERMLKVEFHKPFWIFILGIYSLIFVLFGGYYFTYFRDKTKIAFYSGLGEAIQYADKQYPNKQIFISERTINMPYIFVSFYNKTDPTEFRKTVVYRPIANNGFREVSHLGHYSFGMEDPNLESIRILSNNELLLSKLNILHVQKFGEYTVIELKKP